MALKRTASLHGYKVTGTLLESAVSSDGTWELVDGCYPGSVTIGGTFVGTVTLYGSDDEDELANSDNAQGVLYETTTPQVFFFLGPIKRMKARFQRTSGSVKVTVNTAASGV